MPRQLAFSRIDGLRYGLLGLPLAFVALPLYVLLPNHYAREYGVPLTALGAVLLGARVFDAVIDPLLGRLSDRLFARSARSVLGFGAAASAVLCIGFALLFFPQWLVDTGRHAALLGIAALLLVVTYAGYSALGIVHQSWGAMLGGDAQMRSRVVGWREGFGLVGVVLASVIPTLAGLPTMVAVFASMLCVGWILWTRAPQPSRAAVQAAAHDGADNIAALQRPFRRAAFRRLLGVFVLNGIASALPATLVLFFVQDRLQAPAAWQPAFLGCYFACAALSIPLWLRVVPRLGLARTWLAGMVLAIVVFAWAGWMDAGDAPAFLVVCALSGAALGTDLVLPSAMLAGVIADAEDRNHAGAYFGWWNLATKLNLALAAGLGLPLLGWAGYVPGARDASALHALSLAYCALPCVLKIAAAGVLWRLVIRAPSSPSSLSKAMP